MESGSQGNSKRLYEIASGQGGYFTAKQAIGAGYSKRLQHYHRQRGNWLAIDHGVFRLRQFPDSRWEELIRWTLWSRNQKEEFQAVASHETAALFYELADYLPVKIHLTVPPGFRKTIPPQMVLHRRLLKPDEAEQQQGFRVTTPFRTLQDLKEAAGERERWMQAVQDAARRGLITLDQKGLLTAN